MRKKTLIAIGGSAGGIPALYEFFDNTLPDAVSYIITTHLYPSQKSALCEMIQKHSSMEVCEVEDRTSIQPDKVYVMPENKVMAIKGGQLILTRRDLTIKVNNAIDIFFDSLAKEKDFNIIAIILSGLGNDGTHGITAISKNGGIIIAQEPESAKNESMPKGVIATGLANFILSPKRMPEKIIQMVRKFNYSKN
jgi:two-component system CheB/CheR fusion protein